MIWIVFVSLCPLLSPLLTGEEQLSHTAVPDLLRLSFYQSQAFAKVCLPLFSVYLFISEKKNTEISLISAV